MIEWPEPASCPYRCAISASARETSSRFCSLRTRSSWCETSTGCALDSGSKPYAYGGFVEASAAARLQSLGGERGGVFRDPPQTREAAKRYLQVRSDAMKRCDVPR